MMKFIFDVLGITAAFVIGLTLFLFTVSGFVNYRNLVGCSKANDVYQCELVTIPKEAVDE
tara:strand:+ start:2940 stop:3119 length:180 start_codon:yes stop_codon:yes gene_type:complete